MTNFMGKEIALQIGKNKTSPPARGRRQSCPEETILMRFIPSCEGQTLCLACFIVCQSDSSPPASGRHSVFMRLSAALNTSLCNLHKCHFQLVTHHFLYIYRQQLTRDFLSGIYWRDTCSCTLPSFVTYDITGYIRNQKVNAANQKRCSG